jgi:hypothetical protein
MNPPTEQLVRDYLNRLAVAAKSTLGPAERQGLLDQTRARIDAESGGLTSASDEKVRKVLAGLGEPIALVEAERTRIDAGQEMAAGNPGLSGTAGNGERVMPLVPRPAVSPESAALVPSGAQHAAAGSDLMPLAEPVPDDDDIAFTLADADPDEDEEEEEEEESWGRRIAAAATAAASYSRRLAAELASLARRHTIEALAVVLIGIGGAAYPPIWLIGAVMAMGSRIWDIRDKWLAIGLPAVLVIVGAALVIVFGGQQNSVGSYLFEAWLWDGRLSRLLALLGGVFLFWRLRRGRRSARLPPWNVPRRLS